MNEIWKTVKGFEKYLVSNLGRVRRVEILNPYLNKDRGYYYISLQTPKKKKNFSLHRLVAETFLGNIDGLEVNHKDFDKKNNRLDNLEWVTRSDNHKHAYKHGRKVVKNSPINFETAEIIRTMNKLGISQKNLAEIYQLKPCSISLIVNNKRWPKT